MYRVKYGKKVIIINYGMISSLTVIILIILIITDWFGFEVQRLGGKKRVCFCLIIIFFLSYIIIPINVQWNINVGGVFLVLIFLISLIKQERIIDRIYLLFAIGVVGTIFFLVKEILLYEPVLLIWDELFLLSIIISMIVILIDFKSEKYVAIIFAGVLLGDFLFRFYHRNELMEIVLGDAIIRDIIWFAILQILLITGIINEFKLLVQKLYKLNKN